MADTLSPGALFSEPKTIPVVPHAEVCPCGGILKVRKSKKRQVVLLDFGVQNYHLTLKNCAVCGCAFEPERLNELVPKGGKFGFDVIEFVGRQVFMEHRPEQFVIDALSARNVKVSASEVEVLSKKFIIYLAQAHKDKEGEIRGLIRKQGGYVLHIDGTCEGGSPHLFCGLDGLTGLVLISKKIRSESTEEIASILRTLKDAYGAPIAVVSDMNQGILAALREIFPSVKHFVCHFHWLRDIGKDLLTTDDNALMKKLEDYDVQKSLNKLAKTLKQLIREYECLYTPFRNDKTFFRQQLSDEALALVIVEWLRHYQDDLAGYGFPFDRCNIALLNRMMIVRQNLQEMKIPLGAGSYLSRIRDLLEPVLEDAAVQNLMKRMKMKIQDFDRLREIMRIALPDGKEGLNDDGEYVNMQTMKKQMLLFYSSRKTAARVDVSYKKMLDQIKKYRHRLFSMGVYLTTAEGEKIQVQPQRTNNMLEQFFRGIGRGERRKSGNKSLKRMLKTMLAEMPYVKNLDNQDYLRVILNGKLTLAERFAQIDVKRVREAYKAHYEPLEKCEPTIKRLLSQPDLLISLARAYAAQTQTRQAA